MQMDTNDMISYDSGKILEYIYSEIDGNFDTIMKDKNFIEALDVSENSICKKLRMFDKNLSNRQIQCQTLTLLYVLILITIECNELKI